MALVQWEPRRMMDFRHEIERMFDRFLEPQENGERGTLTAAWRPAADLTEHEDEFVLRADLPGVSRDDVNVQITGNVLTLSGERKEEHGEEGDDHYERVFGRFTRSFSLPSHVEADKVSASFKDGVLTVKVPKSESAKARRIEIK